MAVQKIVPNPEYFTPQEVVDTLMMTQGWFIAEETVHYTPKLTNRIAAMASDMRGPIYRLFKGQALPAEHMVQRRVEIQVLSILGQFHPVIDFGAITREWTSGAEPATELGRLEREWRLGARAAVAS